MLATLVRILTALGPTLSSTSSQETLTGHFRSAMSYSMAVATFMALLLAPVFHGVDARLAMAVASSGRSRPEANPRPCEEAIVDETLQLDRVQMR